MGDDEHQSSRGTPSLSALGGSRRLCDVIPRSAPSDVPLLPSYAFWPARQRISLAVSAPRPAEPRSYSAAAAANQASLPPNVVVTPHDLHRRQRIGVTAIPAPAFAQCATGCQGRQAFLEFQRATQFDAVRSEDLGPEPAGFSGEFASFGEVARIAGAGEGTGQELLSSAPVAGSVELFGCEGEFEPPSGPGVVAEDAAEGGDLSDGNRRSHGSRFTFE
jgi:hypothetical protein